MDEEKGNRSINQSFTIAKSPLDFWHSYHLVLIARMSRTIGTGPIIQGFSALSVHYSHLKDLYKDRPMVLSPEFLVPCVGALTSAFLTHLQRMLLQLLQGYSVRTTSGINRGTEL